MYGVWGVGIWGFEDEDGGGGVIGWAMGVFGVGGRLKHNTCKTSVPP